MMPCVFSAPTRSIKDQSFDYSVTVRERLFQIMHTFMSYVHSDVVHQSCLDKYGCSVPANTTPAGYACPRCKVSTHASIIG